MGKNKNAALKAAPKVESPKVEDPKKKDSRIEVIDVNKFTEQVKKNTAGGLDPNHQVDLLKMTHETFRMDPNAAQKYNMSPEAVDKINHITAIGQVAILANEVIYAENPFAVTMRASQLKLIAEAAQEIGVTIDQKMLPAPNEKNEVEVPSKAFKVSKETKKTLEKEKKILDNNEPEMDVTKMDSEEKLKESLVYLMSQRVNVFDNIQKCISLYTAYKNYQANNSENKEKELEKIASMTRIELLNEVIDLIKEAPIVIHGIGKFMYTVTQGTKSPISAFCSFRNASINKETGVSSFSDQFIADVTKCIVIWAKNIKIAENEKSIAAVEENLKNLKKDSKKNADAIKDQEERLKSLKGNIEHINKVTEYITNPESSIADNLIDLYNKKDANATKIFNIIVDSYFNGVDISELKFDLVKKNVQQIAGIIINMFRDPLSQITEYKEANLLNISDLKKEEDDRQKLINGAYDVLTKTKKPEDSQEKN